MMRGKTTFFKNGDNTEAASRRSAKKSIEQEAFFDQLLLKIKEAENQYEQEQTKEHLAILIRACERYLSNIPAKRRERTTETIAWATLLPEWPDAERIVAIQKKAVSRLFLPTAKTLAKARIALIKELVLDGEEAVLGAGRMLDKNYWSEIKYKGKNATAAWIKGDDYCNTYYLQSYLEILLKEKAANKIDRKNTAYFENPDAYKVTVSDGRLYRGKRFLDTRDAKDVFRNTENKILYVVGRDGSIYAAGSAKTKSRLHHSSFLSGKRVLCAGTMEVHKGRLKVITIESGHYKPGVKDLLKFLNLLQNQHAMDLSKIRVIDRSGMPKNAERYLKTGGYCLPEPEERKAYFFNKAMDEYESKHDNHAAVFLDVAAAQGDPEAQFYQAICQLENIKGYAEQRVRGLANLDRIAHQENHPYQHEAQYLKDLNMEAEKPQGVNMIKKS